MLTTELQAPPLGNVSPPTGEARGHSVRLLFYFDAADSNGSPRPGRPVLRAFATITAALAAKQTMEAAR